MFEKIKQKFQKKKKAMVEVEEEENYENAYTDYSHMFRSMYYNPVLFSPCNRAEVYCIAVEHDIRILERELELVSILNTKDSFVYWCDHYETICDVLDSIIGLREELRCDLHSLPEVKNWLNNGQTGWIPENADIFVDILVKFPVLLVEFKEAIKISEIMYQLFYHSIEDVKTLRDVYLTTARSVDQLFEKIPEPDYVIPGDPPLWTNKELMEIENIRTRARILAQSSD